LGITATGFLQAGCPKEYCCGKITSALSSFFHQDALE